MRRRTTTQKLRQAITNNLLHIAKAEIYHKSTRQTDVISADVFQESLDFLCETIFADSIGWYFEENYETQNYEIDCGRMDGSSDIIVIAHLCANGGVDVEDVNKALLMMEEE